MATTLDLAELIFPEVTTTVEELESQKFDGDQTVKEALSNA